MIEFKDLPAEIQERMLNEQVRQGNSRNAEVFEEDITTGFREGGFNWDASVEGHTFWVDVFLGGNFAAFYGRYPKARNNSNN